MRTRPAPGPAQGHERRRTDGALAPALLSRGNDGSLTSRGTARPSLVDGRLQLLVGAPGAIPLGVSAVMTVVLVAFQLRIQRLQSAPDREGSKGKEVAMERNPVVHASLNVAVAIGASFVAGLAPGALAIGRHSRQRNRQRNGQGVPRTGGGGRITHGNRNRCHPSAA